MILCFQDNVLGVVNLSEMGISKCSLLPNVAENLSEGLCGLRQMHENHIRSFQPLTSNGLVLLF